MARPGVNRLVMALVRSPLGRLLTRRLAVLRYTAPTSGRIVELPVAAVPYESGWMVAVGGHEGKRWWKAFRQPLAATLQVGTRRHAVTGQVLDGTAREKALAAYLEKMPMARGASSATPVVRLRPLELAR